MTFTTVSKTTAAIVNVPACSLAILISPRSSALDDIEIRLWSRIHTRLFSIGDGFLMDVYLFESVKFWLRHLYFYDGLL